MANELYLGMMHKRGQWQMENSKRCFFVFDYDVADVEGMGRRRGEE